MEDFYEAFCFFFVGAAFFCCRCFGALKFVDAEQLGLVNKLGPTKNRYHRVDTDKYDLTQTEANLLRMPAGMALVFRTIHRRSSCGRTI